MYIKAENISQQKAGSRLCIDGEWYLLLETRDMEDIAHLTTGITGHWSIFVFFDAQIEIIAPKAV